MKNCPCDGCICLPVCINKAKEYKKTVRQFSAIEFSGVTVECKQLRNYLGNTDEKFFTKRNEFFKILGIKKNEKNKL